jgi:hypothetical protein
VAAGVRDRLTNDADECLALVGGDRGAPADVDLEVDAHPARDLLRGLDEGNVERLVHGSSERGDRTTRLVQRPLGGRGQVPVRLCHDVGELLGHAVVQLARDTPPLRRSRAPRL